jgi:hypothetical protein
MIKNRMFTVTQTLNGTPHRKIYVAKDHVVAIYPILFKDGGGCHVELSTDNGDEGAMLQVEQSADTVASRMEGVAI